MKIEDIIFWLLIIAVIGVIIWMLSGSPPLENSLLMISIFIATSELLLWKALFKIDKKTALGFEKIKKSMNNNYSQIKNHLNKIEDSLKK